MDAATVRGTSEHSGKTVTTKPAGGVLRAGGDGAVATEWILHVDLDEFLAAVEVARRPELRGRPVVVGGSGDPTQRRVVVATASYEARACGVHSGMPLRMAARRCPHAVFLPSDPPVYEEASRRVMTTLRRFPAAVEMLGWDEAFLGARTGDPEGLAALIQRAVRAETQLRCSVGIGDNKHRAKLATGFAKPAGVYRLTRDNWMAVMAERPTTALWGIGARTARKLAELGLDTVAELAAADPVELAGRFGPTVGPSLQRLGLGAGDTVVSDAPRVPRSRSRETTFPRDLTDRSQIEEQVAVLASGLAREAAAEGRRVARVAVKARFAPFFTRTHARTLPAPTSDERDIERAALAVLNRFEETGPVRLLGVRVEFDRA
ncbi:MAG TPA: DNA polymerase IV [Egibacteraceae bacterium]|nr:DNA polymerase IV [Actinomycetota bacterium]HWB71540.1 DNA polymerase IV [Egibacteraceae bacterium]